MVQWHLKFGLFFLALCLTGFAGASQALTSGDFTDVLQTAHGESQRVGREHVLVVYDLDNTLMAMDQDLGSDQWYDWQASLLANPAKRATSDGRVANDLVSLLSVQRLLYGLGRMHLTQASVSQVVAKLRAEGFTQMVLTARGTEMREATMRELNRNGLAFSWAQGGNAQKGSGDVTTFLPYHIEAPEADCMSHDDVIGLGLKPARSASFGDGVLLSAGQHKGAVLRGFICHLSSEIKSIIFVDDKQKNTDAVQAAYKGLPVEVTTYRYSQEDARVAGFYASDKSKVKSDWLQLQSTLRIIFGEIFAD